MARGLLSRYRPLNHQQGAPITDNGGVSVCAASFIPPTRQDATFSRRQKQKDRIQQPKVGVANEMRSFDKYSTNKRRSELSMFAEHLMNESISFSQTRF